jgi:DNA-binding CsgD family transcriptional regulator
MRGQYQYIKLFPLTLTLSLRERELCKIIAEDRR